MSTDGKSAIRIALITSVTSIVVAVIGLMGTFSNNMSLDTQSENLSDQAEQITNQAENISSLASISNAGLDQGQKLCSLVDNGKFRDTFLVPREWTASNCEDYRRTTLIPLLQLGCAFKDEIVLGGFGGATPSRNCGW